jgi:hypothetical protein
MDNESNVKKNTISAKNEEIDKMGLIVTKEKQWLFCIWEFLMNRGAS